ncbi:hypothetical protein FRC09_011910 [Ceratobasidium sp. 395]|nr:hypothetical protein FRC09_011910 [Ceratobasidium sp. 395]
MARITGPAIQPTLATLLNTHALAPSMTAALPATCTVTQATQIHPTERFSSLRTPSHGTVVSVRGILSAIAADETAAILLGAITFVPSSGFHRSDVAACGSSPSAALGNVGRTKRERRQGPGELPTSKKARTDHGLDMLLTGEDSTLVTDALDKAHEASTSSTSSNQGLGPVVQHYMRRESEDK